MVDVGQWAGDRNQARPFEEMVGTALDGLPEELGRVMANVAVTVRHSAGPPGLLGLYEEGADRVRRTVIHEVGHHFGISDSRLRELGW
jgi:predicted Zn-dependent protease with MMP-like domain